MRDDDTIRYSILHDVDRLRETLERDLPLGVAHSVGHAVHEFGGNTAALLRHVYLTLPMVNAAPGEVLVFSPRSSDVGNTSRHESDRLTAKQRRERKQMLSSLREKVRGRLAERVAV